MLSTGDALNRSASRTQKILLSPDHTNSSLYLRCFVERHIVVSPSHGDKTLYEIPEDRLLFYLDALSFTISNLNDFFTCALFGHERNLLSDRVQTLFPKSLHALENMPAERPISSERHKLALCLRFHETLASGNLEFKCLRNHQAQQPSSGSDK